MTVYADLTEYLNNPVLSGIQRVTAQLCRFWPDDDLRPVRLATAGYLTEVDRGVIKAIAASFECEDGSSMDVIQRARRMEEPPLRLKSSDVVLVPELFYDPARVAYYRNLSAEEVKRYRFIVYDLTPIAYPQYFQVNMPMDEVCGYFQMVRRMPNCGFISKATQRDFCKRLLRSPETTGVVLRLGSDGLGPKPQNPVPERPTTFTVLGRIEPSKNPGMVVEAFEPLLPRFPGLRITFLGKIGHIDAQLARKFECMSKDPSSGLRHIAEPKDKEIRQCFDESRASIFVSGAEGFGLPPVESLWRGTPAILSQGIPSVENIGSTGVHIVDPLTVENLRMAVLAFLEDSYAQQKAREAASLELPTWQSFSDEVSSWCRSAV